MEVKIFHLNRFLDILTKGIYRLGTSNKNKIARLSRQRSYVQQEDRVQPTRNRQETRFRFVENRFLQETTRKKVIFITGALRYIDLQHHNSEILCIGKGLKYYDGKVRGYHHLREYLQFLISFFLSRLYFGQTFKNYKKFLPYGSSNRQSSISMCPVGSFEPTTTPFWVINSRSSVYHWLVTSFGYP